ncbi:MAG: hypothetical protein HY735_34060 [Verrucomicrobia bacterium]|nr:hypothetical protein [Verrucomicrobiota bacterium]
MMRLINLGTAVRPKETKEAKEFEAFEQARSFTCRGNGTRPRTSFLSAFFVFFGHQTAGLRIDPPHRLKLLSLALAAVHAGLLSIVAVDFYVAPSGNEQWPGTSEQPFATLTQARDAARKSSSDQPRRIVIRGGQIRRRHRSGEH